MEKGGHLPYRCPPFPTYAEDHVRCPRGSILFGGLNSIFLSAPRLRERLPVEFNFVLTGEKTSRKMGPV